MILKNTNNFSVTVHYGIHTLSLTAGATVNVQDYLPENLPEGVILLEKGKDQMITEPNNVGKKAEMESVDNSKLLLG